MQYDIILADKPNAPGPVVVTVTSEDAAKGIVGVLNRNTDHFYQGAGLKAFYREVDREPKSPEYYDAKAEDLIDASKDVDEISQLEDATTLEKAHPRFKDGRKSVLRAYAERIRHLKADPPGDAGEGLPESDA